MNYCVTRRELLSCVWCLKAWRQHLLGRRFVVRTDNSAVSWFRKSRDLIGQPGRWLEYIEEFDFEIVHRPGSRHGNADALSRRPCEKNSCVCHQLDTEQVVENRRATLIGGSADSPISTLCWNSEEMTTAQDQDADISWIKTLIAAGMEKPAWEAAIPRSKEAKTLWHQWERLKIFQNVLFRRWETAEGCHVRWQVILPAIFRNDFLQLAHTGLTGGHLGRHKTEMQVSQRAYWPTWRSDVNLYILRCHPCAQYMRGGPPRQVGLQPMVAGTSFERVSIDITGKHPPFQQVE